MILKGLIDSGVINTIYTESDWLILDRINGMLAAEGKSAIKKTIREMGSIELKYWADNGFWDYLTDKIIQGKVKLIGFDLGASQSVVMGMLEDALQLPSVKEYMKENKKDFKEVKVVYENINSITESSMVNDDMYLQQKSFILVVKAGYRAIHATYKIKQWQSVLDYFYWLSKGTPIYLKNK